jgi:Zn-dependent protease with chaperone function
MDEFFTGERTIDLVLLLIALETIALMVLWRMRRCPLPPVATLLILAPGAFLLLAARAALAGASWVWVSSLFLVALFTHLVDLRQRWQERSRQDSTLGAQGKDFLQAANREDLP